ncbi:Bug family tripartite tricarboxylate transporter substrate binding protein [Muricoccus radiodurans]|uniref:Bug family tripartite tricarboxylate transporter substrate binding protein n=1 Tax=Muricoccus radiodurans TaxID=2231721 RepID=UPI003CEDC062
MNRRTLLAAGGTLALPLPALAQPAWPRRPIVLVIPSAAGGATDTVGRIIAQKLTESLGVSVVAENRPGAGGSIATEYGAFVPPDGHILTLGQLGTLAVNQHLFRVRFDPLRDFVPVALVAQVPSILVVNPKMGTRTVQEFVAYAKANPGKVNYGSAGAGSATHIIMAAFQEAAGIELTHVPYRGSGPVMTDLVAGNIDCAITGTPAGAPFARAGTLWALVATSPQRLALLPDVPTVAETIQPGFEGMQWFGIIAPARTPPEIVTRLNQAVNEAVVTQEVRQRLADEGADPDPRTPEAFRALIAAEIERWGALVRRQNIRADG